MFLKYILLEQKIFESEAEIDDFVQANEIDDSTMVQSIIFDKEVFEGKDEVVEWTRTHGFGIDKEIDESSKSFIVAQYDIGQFNADTLRDIEIRRGVKAVVGTLLEVEGMSDVHFSLRNFDGIKFSEQVPHIIEIAKVVKGFHPAYGEVELTKNDLRAFALNFQEKVAGVDIAIDYDHDANVAAGWIKDVFLSMDGTILYGEVRWTPKGALALSDREYRYFSPEFNRDYVHPHTLKAHGPTLLGGALVNRPFLKMDAIVSFKEQQGGKVDTIKLSEHQTVVAEKDKEIAELKLSEGKAKDIIKSLKDDNVSLSEKVKTLETEREAKERDEKFNKLFADNKINKAQLDALKDGKGTLEVLALSEKLNVEAAGSDKGNKIVSLSDEEKRMCERLGLTPEEYADANKNY